MRRIQLAVSIALAVTYAALSAAAVLADGGGGWLPR
jgi:hypothetical protein